MVFLLWVGGIIALMLFLVCMRAFKAQKRLQICIDNGKLKFDGVQIEICENLGRDESAKLELERDFYLRVKRLFKTIPGPLYKKNSAYN